MNRKKLFPILMPAFFFSSLVFSQDKNPFESIGKKGEIVTLTKGQYEELFDQTDIQQIGTALINIRTMKVVKLLSDADAEKRLDNTSSSRFLSVDPLTSSYPMLTPYQFASNRPIDGTDLDGKEYENFRSKWIVKNKGVAALPIIKSDNGYGPLVKAKYDLKIQGKQEDFNRLMETYTTNPGVIHNPDNEFAQYYPLKEPTNKGSHLGVGDHMFIDIAGPFNDYVRFTDIKVTGNSFYIKAATLYGHTDAGEISFSGSYDSKNGIINFSIYNETTNNIGADALTINAGRMAQTAQWKLVLNNVSTFLGGKVEDKTVEKEISIQNPKKGDAIKVTKENLVDGKKTEEYKQKE